MPFGGGTVSDVAWRRLLSVQFVALRVHQPHRHRIFTSPPACARAMNNPAPSQIERNVAGTWQLACGLATRSFLKDTRLQRALSTWIAASRPCETQCRDVSTDAHEHRALDEMHLHVLCTSSVIWLRSEPGSLRSQWPLRWRAWRLRRTMAGNRHAPSRWALIYVVQFFFFKIFMEANNSCRGFQTENPIARHLHSHCFKILVSDLYEMFQKCPVRKRLCKPGGLSRSPARRPLPASRRPLPLSLGAVVFIARSGQRYPPRSPLPPPPPARRRPPRNRRPPAAPTPRQRPSAASARGRRRWRGACTDRRRRDGGGGLPAHPAPSQRVGSTDGWQHGEMAIPSSPRPPPPRSGLGAARAEAPDRASQA